MTQARVLVVDDDDTLRGLLKAELGQRGFEVSTAPGVQAAIATLGSSDLDVALVDLRLGDGSGLDVLTWVRAQRPAVEVILLTGHGSIDTAIQAMRAGAYDYLRKPCPVAELEVVLQRALEHKLLLERNSMLSDALAPADMGADFVGHSPRFRQLCSLVDRVASTDSSVLILGETGVGKDVVAKLIHARSTRARQPLVVVECAALHEELLHSELFGHEKGAYTGATQPKHGLFEVAHRGTIFLDEIGDVSLATQVKLLRVLETGCFRHVGGTREISVDVRLLAATNRDLADMMERGYFRRDLFYRLSTIQIEVPALRQRIDDIPVLVQHFLERLNQRYGQHKRFSPAALARLARHPWPGNVRELLHVIEHAVIVAGGDLLDEVHLPAELRESEARSDTLQTLEQLERQHIARVLAAVAGNRQQAASVLGISERTLYRKVKEYALERA